MRGISVPMVNHLHCTRYASRRSERGQALLFLLALLGLATGMFVYSMVRNVSLTNADNNTNALVLAQAKEALIGYAASDNNFPGSLPCPDLTNNGTADPYVGNECPGFVAGSNVYLGRLPWRTLGLPDLRDSSGERLWYAVSRDFARNPWCLPNCPLNSDTLGQLTVTGVAPAGNVIAIIFASGTSLGTQARDAAGVNAASNYLEDENADGNNSIFTTQASSPTFNDRLLAITNGDLMPLVEQRVAREMISILQRYKAATGTSTLLTLLPGIGVYPWTDRSDGGSNDWNHNRFPCGAALPVNWNTLVPLSLATTPALPLWLTNGCPDPVTGLVTGWTSVIYYAVARNKLENNGLLCSNCTDVTLTVTNPSSRIADLCPTTGTTCSSTVVSDGSADLILITSGAATAYPRCASPPCWPPADFSPIPIPGYFEDAENAENSGIDSDKYVVPRSTNYDRDRIYIVR